MVGRLVEEQDVGLGQKQLAQRHATSLTARQADHIGIGRRAAQGVHRHLDLVFEIPQILGIDDVLELCPLLRRLVGVVHHQFVIAIENGLLVGNALHHVFHDGLVGIEMRLLRQIADGRAFRRPGFTGEFGVMAGHDLQQRRLTRAVRAEDADLGIGVEGEMDVVENLLVPISLGEAGHVIDELASHGALYAPSVEMR